MQMEMKMSSSYEAPASGEIFANCSGKGSLALHQEGAIEYWPRGFIFLRFLYANESFPGIRALLFLYLGPWFECQSSDEAEYSVSLYVSYQYFQSLSLIYFPHTWTWKGSSVLLWGFLTFIECLELSWITQTLVFVLKDFKKLTKDSQLYRPYFTDPQTFQVLPLPHRLMHHLCCNLS